MTVHPGEGPRIVVGVDGSESSKQALRWALRQAEVTGSALEAVTAWEYPQLYGSLGWMPPLSEEEVDFERIARHVLLDAVKEVAGPEPSVEMRTTVAFGPPTSVLLEASKGASLLVLGSRGHGGFTEALLGSVGQHCTHHATCPVVIIRGVPENP
ncbi:universal stress protein [Streptomyces griseoluteus]|uniref:universal stress protein n=1 Tax=Streptomyces griseoluteus TaxID=29306 RepID=UPI0036F7AA4F